MILTALILSTISLVFSIINFIELRAQAKSTHRVQFVDPLKDWEKELELKNEEAKESNELDNIF